MTSIVSVFKIFIFILVVGADPIKQLKKAKNPTFYTRDLRQSTRNQNNYTTKINQLHQIHQ